MGKMSSTFVLLFVIFGQVLMLMLLSLNGVEARSSFEIGQRQDGDRLVLRDSRSSRPASTSEPPKVSFTYNLTEAITYIEFSTEENISAEVKLTYFDSLIIGEVRLLSNNDDDDDDEREIEDYDIETQSEAPEIENLENLSGFDVVIMIFGFDESVSNLDPGLVLNHDTPYEGKLRIVIEDNFGNYDTFNDTVEPELTDKFIEIGQRQAGDSFIFESASSTLETADLSNHTVIFYFIDSVHITFIKFVIFDHFVNHEVTSVDYIAPVAEYSHYTAGTFKATITEYNTKSMFAQMFVYGYDRQDEIPADYKPFLPPQERTQPPADVALTPMQRLQLLLMTQQATTPPPSEGDDDDDDDDEEERYLIRPEDMIPDHKPVASIPNGALKQLHSVESCHIALLGLLIWTVV